MLLAYVLPAQGVLRGSSATAASSVDIPHWQAIPYQYAGDLAADLIVFSKSLKKSPGLNATEWRARSELPACNWTGITCADDFASSAEFIIALPDRELGGDKRPLSRVQGLSLNCSRGNLPVYDRVAEP